MKRKVPNQNHLYMKKKEKRELVRISENLSRRIELDFEVVMCRLVLNAVKESRILSH